MTKFHSRRYPLSIRSQNVVEKISTTNLEFKIIRYEIDHPDSWKSSVTKKKVNQLNKEKGGRILEMNYNKFVKFHHSTHKLSKITDVKGLSYSLLSEMLYSEWIQLLIMVSEKCIDC